MPSSVSQEEEQQQQQQQQQAEEEQEQLKLEFKPEENLVLTIQETLQKRLGMTAQEEHVTPLTEAETVHLMLASEALMDELERIATTVTTQVSADNEANVLFGGGGIAVNDDDNEELYKLDETDIWSF